MIWNSIMMWKNVEPKFKFNFMLFEPKFKLKFYVIWNVNLNSLTMLTCVFMADVFALTGLASL